jgi:predicted TIM-barrel fold metal-dependent hydrolase
MMSPHAEGWTRRALVSSGLAMAAVPARAGGLAFTMPAGACDAHHHIYDPRFPYLPDARRQASATVDDYRAFQKNMGTSRDVIVLPSAYGFDNNPLFYFQGRMGENTRSIAVIRSDVSGTQLKDLAAVGVKGVRIQFRSGGGGFFKREDIAPIATRIVPLGWHVQFHMPGALLAELETLILDLPTPVVIDHMGHASGIDQPQYRTVRKLLDSGKGWIKVSGINMDSKIGPPTYRDTAQVARSYIRANPQRVVWGSNWPFPGENPVPDIVVVLNVLSSEAGGGRRSASHSSREPGTIIRIRFRAPPSRHRLLMAICRGWPPNLHPALRSHPELQHASATHNPIWLFHKRRIIGTG